MPDAASLIARLPDMADSIHNAAIDLVRHQTVESLDQCVARVKAAEQTLTHLRRALLADGVPPDVVI
jgi:hypothetical protein